MNKPDAGTEEVDAPEFTPEGEDAANAQDPENPETDSKQQASENDDQGGEGGENDAGGGGNDEGGGEAEAGDEGEEGQPTVEERLATLEKERDDLRAQLEAKNNPQQPAAPAQLTEEQWASLEQKSGHTRQQIEFTLNIASNLERKMVALINSKLSSMEKPSVLERLSKQKGFEEIAKYSDGINEYLKARVRPDMHNNEDVLKDAFYWARGRGAGQEVRRAQANKVVSRNIIGKASARTPAEGRPASGGGNLKMTPEEKLVWERQGHKLYKTPQEYLKAARKAQPARR